MKFDIDFERTYPHPIKKVWHAITDRAALGIWLMETDFVAEQGRAFTMWCENDSGQTDTYLCTVLELEPPRRMVWSWILDGKQSQGETCVEFRLRETGDGTSLTIRHSGDRDRDTIDRFKSGWPSKLRQLEDTLEPET